MAQLGAMYSSNFSGLALGVTSGGNVMSKWLMEGASMSRHTTPVTCNRSAIPDSLACRTISGTPGPSPTINRLAFAKCWSSASKRTICGNPCQARTYPANPRTGPGPKDEGRRDRSGRQGRKTFQHRWRSPKSARKMRLPFQSGRPEPRLPVAHSQPRATPAPRTSVRFGEAPGRRICPVAQPIAHAPPGSAAGKRATPPIRQKSV